LNIISPVAFSIIALLSLQAFLLSILLFFKEGNKQTNTLLALTLIFYGLAAFNVALFYILAWYDLIDIIPYLQIELLFGLGPSLYLYTKSVTDPSFKMSKWDFLHFVPVLIEFIYYRTSFYRMGAISLSEYPQSIYNSIFIVEQWTGTIITSVYIILSVRLLVNFHKWVKNNYSNLNNKMLIWLVNLVMAYALFWFIWHIIRLGDMFIYADAYRNVYFYPMFILLSAITCWIGFKGYVKSQIDAVGFSQVDKGILLTKTQKQNLSTDIIDKITEAMEKDKLYLDPNFNMSVFSIKLELNSRLISKAINTELKINFLEFVNRYRVEEFKKRLKSPYHHKYTLLGHAFESGFASKSTFNHIFKKHTLTTPKKYYASIHDYYQKIKSEKVNSDE
jgi:AraC-like DNA-binding protein